MGGGRPVTDPPVSLSPQMRPCMRPPSPSSPAITHAAACAAASSSSAPSPCCGPSWAPSARWDVGPALMARLRDQIETPLLPRLVLLRRAGGRPPAPGLEGGEGSRGPPTPCQRGRVSAQLAMLSCPGDLLNPGISWWRWFLFLLFKCIFHGCIRKT